MTRNKKLPTNCAICSEPVKPNEKGIYNLTCGKTCQSKLASLNASRNVKLGLVSKHVGRSY